MSRFLTALAMLAILSTTANADTVVYNLDFDSTFIAGAFTTGSGATGVSFTGPGNPGNGAELSFDSSIFSAGFFADVDIANNPGSVLNQPTSTALVDYVLTFDVLATGFENVSSASGQARFEVGNQRFIDNASFTITDQFTTVSIPLGTGVPAVGPAVDPADFLAVAGRPEFTISILGANNGDFGSDTDNTFVVDNLSLVQLEVVPEPSSIALLSFGIAGLALRRRRNR